MSTGKRKPTAYPEYIELLFAMQQKELRKIESTSVKAMRAALLEAKTSLRKSIKEIGAGGDKVNLARHRAMLLQVEHAGLVLSRRTGEVLTAAKRAAATKSLAHLAKKLDAAEAHFAFKSVIPFKQVERLVTKSSMLRKIEEGRIANGAAKYGLDLVGTMERLMAQSLLTQQSMSQASAAILGKGPWAEKAWQAERLVRTEVSYSYNAVARVGFDKVARGDKRLWIEWVEHAYGPQWGGPKRKPWPGPAARSDKRTADDSLRLHGQLRRPGQSFVDPSSGMRFAHPPNRPNCRGHLMLVNIEEVAPKDKVA